MRGRRPEEVEKMKIQHKGEGRRTTFRILGGKKIIRKKKEKEWACEALSDWSKKKGEREVQGRDSLASYGSEKKEEELTTPKGGGERGPIPGKELSPNW